VRRSRSTDALDRRHAVRSRRSKHGNLLRRNRTGSRGRSAKRAGGSDRHVELLRSHFPYHESDHVLNIAFNALADGTCLEDLKKKRADEAYLNALGAKRIPDTSTAGDFCRRFESKADIDCLHTAIDEARRNVWSQQLGTHRQNLLQAIAYQRTLGRIMNVRFHDERIGSQFCDRLGNDFVPFRNDRLTDFVDRLRLQLTNVVANRAPLELGVCVPRTDVHNGSQLDVIFR
jgi:hypothetical protein